MIQYRKETTSQDYVVRTNDDNTETWIPTDPNNSDYQVYLATLPSNSSDPVEAEKPKK